MDEPDDDAVKRRECWELALAEVMSERIDGMKLFGDSIFQQKRRSLVIETARADSEKYTAYMQRFFGDLDLAMLVRQVRVKYAEIRLGGTL